MFPHFIKSWEYEKNQLENLFYLWLADVLSYSLHQTRKFVNKFMAHWEVEQMPEDCWKNIGVLVY